MFIFNHLCGVILLYKGRGIARGKGQGPLLVSPAPISFLAGVDPETGIIVEKEHPLKGKSIAGTVLTFPYGKGSTVGSYVLYALSRNGHAPAAIINAEAEPIITTGAILGEIPMVDRLDIPMAQLMDGVRVTVNGDLGEIEFDAA
jgi:predicted aconitase with swiveling domain